MGELMPGFKSIQEMQRLALIGKGEDLSKFVEQSSMARGGSAPIRAGRFPR